MSYDDRVTSIAHKNDIVFLGSASMRAHDAGDFDRRGRLVERAQAGDREATEQLATYALARARVLAVGVVGTRDGAFDLAQECAASAIFDIASLQSPRAFDAWFTKRATRQAIRWAKAQRRREFIGKTAPLDIEMPDDSVDVEREGEQAHLKVAVRRALGHLPVRQRAAIVLRYLMGMTEPEVADALGCSEGTAASLLSRARTRLSRSPALQGYTNSEGDAHDE